MKPSNTPSQKPDYKLVNDVLVLGEKIEFEDLETTRGGRYHAILIPASRQSEFMKSGFFSTVQHVTPLVVFYTDIK